MLLRAGLVYVLSVLTVLLGGLAAWQHLDISLRDESAAALSKRIIILQSDLSALSRREEAAIRRARVAEDSLTRNETYNSSDAAHLNTIKEQLALAQRDKAEAEAARNRLESDLALALKERDEIRVERDELQRATDAARVAADKALQEADTARQELSDLKAAPPAVSAAAPPPANKSPATAVVAPDIPKAVVPAGVKSNVTTSEAKVSTDEPIRPATEMAVSNDSDTKATLLPSAVTIDPVPTAKVPEMRVVKAPATRREAVKSEPRRQSKPKTAAPSTSAAKKPPKQAKKDEPFFPF